MNIPEILIVNLLKMVVSQSLSLLMSFYLTSSANPLPTLDQLDIDVDMDGSQGHHMICAIQNWK